MKLIPFYRVSYCGAFYDAQEAFEIDPADREEMSRHGKILDELAPAVSETQKHVEAPAEVKPKRGRPRRVEDGQP